MKLSLSPPPYADAPVVVLISGLGGSGSYWLPQLAVLEQEGYLKIAYKTRTTTKGRPESVYIRTDGPGNPEENQGPRREYQKEQR